MEVVVEDNGRQVGVRIITGTVFVVLAVPDRVPEFVRIGRERVSVEEADIIGLLCLLNR